MNKISKKSAADGVKNLIRYIGDDPKREGLMETPQRVLRAFSEMFRGYTLDPKDILKKRFTDDSEMVILSNIDLYSTCEHHMLPFIGKCHIAYLPDGQVVGVSKLARLADVFARRLQIQERLTRQIAKSLYTELKPKGVAVMIKAQHMCMVCRGVSQSNPKMITSEFMGDFKNNQTLRDEFLKIIS